MSLAEAAAAPTAAPGPAQPGHVSPTPATTSPGEKGEAGTPVPAGTTAAAIPAPCPLGAAGSSRFLPWVPSTQPEELALQTAAEPTAE